MDIGDLFHDSSDVHKRVRSNWKWKRGVFPVPKFRIRCPECRCRGGIQLSNISYSKREDSKHPYRAEPSFKCTACSFFWTHGIVCPKEVYRKATGEKEKRTWRWREVKEVLDS